MVSIFYTGIHVKTQVYQSVIFQLEMHQETFCGLALSKPIQGDST